MESHYIIVVCVIVAIIAFQLYIFLNTRRKIRSYRAIFPDSRTGYAIVQIRADTEDDEESYASQIKTGSDNCTFGEIVRSLNMYLQKNKGAASDFYLMKDVVERYCDAEEEEITIQLPIPLYLGLMGTMVGIIIGIGFIAVSGGLSSESLVDNITPLMTCVAIAMGASLFGILCTTILSWISKNATMRVEAAKNRFYSWLQTELLPVLSGNTANALHLLQHNLSVFNQTFQANISGLDSVLSKIRDSAREQTELISLIRDLDVKRLSDANIRVLRELKGCTGEIESFNKYMHNVSQYLSSVNALNSNINEHLNRTAAIERMGAFFEQEITQIEARKQYINQTVARVDDTMLKTFEQLSESSTRGLAELKNKSVAEFDAVVKIFEEQRQDFRCMLQSQRDELDGCVAAVKTAMSDLRDASDTRALLSALLKSSEEQSLSMNRLADAVHMHLAADGRTDDVEREPCGSDERSVDSEPQHVVVEMQPDDSEPQYLSEELAPKSSGTRDLSVETVSDNSETHVVLASRIGTENREGSVPTWLHFFVKVGGYIIAIIVWIAIILRLIWFWLFN